MKRSFIVIFLASALAACGYPSKAEVEKDFQRLASERVPAGMSLEVLSTYRGDGDADSFSQVVVFRASASQDVTVQTGWLSGLQFKKGEQKTDGRVELIYRRKNGEAWTVADDGVTKAPS